MPDVYRCEVSFDGVATTDPAPGAGSATDDKKIAFQVQDTNGATNQKKFGIIATLTPHSFGGGPTFEYQASFEFGDFGLGAPANPFNGSLALATLTEADGNNGAAIFNGGALMIEKDEVAQTMTFTCPLGSQTFTWAAIGGVSAGAMRPTKHGIQWFRPGPPFTISGSWESDFYAFWAARNSGRFLGASLSSTQPGTWNAIQLDGDDILNPNAPQVNVQEEARFQFKFTYQSADGTRDVINSAWREWAGGDTIADIPLYLDLTRDPATGVLWFTRIQKHEPESVSVGRSEDGGATWIEDEKITVPGGFNSTPSLSFIGGRLFLWWRDGRKVRVAYSENHGRGFGTSVELPLSDRLDSLHHTVDPVNGAMMVVYRDDLLDELRVEGSMAPGAPTTLEVGPVLLATGIINTLYPEIQRYRSGVFHIAYTVGGNKRFLRSDSHGQIWTELYDAASAELHPAHREVNGLTYHLFWEAGGALKHYKSENDSITVLDSPAATVATGVAEQRADLELRPEGGVLVVYQTYDSLNDEFDIVTRRSDDYGRSWV